MFIAVVFGYVMTSVMVFCGVFSIVNFFQSDLHSLGAVGYIQGLAVASWPLVVASALFTLVQVALLLEKLVIYSSMAPAGMPEPDAKPEKKDPAPRRNIPAPAVTRSFFHIEPGSVPPPAPEERFPDSMELDSIAELAHQTDSERTNPQAPGQSPAAAPQEPAPAKRPGEGLSFFRVD